MTPSNLPPAYLQSDIDNMPQPWRKDFDAEVEAGNFMIGGKSLILNGPGAENAARHWLACLLLANFKCYRTTPFELIRRAQGLPVPGDNDDRTYTFLNAECILIDDFFDDFQKALNDEQLYLLAWHLRELIRNGVTCILSTDIPHAEIPWAHDTIGKIVEENFEVIRHGDETPAKAETKPRKKIVPHPKR